MLVYFLFVICFTSNADEIKIEPLPEILEVSQDVQDVRISVEVRDETLFVESYIPDFTFRTEADDPERTKGYMTVSVDGERAESVHQAAFTITGLSEGEHHVHFQLYDLEHMLLYEHEETVQMS
ncbi:hypothetical protein JCM19037_2453 [Geomicrobium sp. JCM 19037]|uniref:hypothetical protein n=1 Tax=unclassified Geomicrobium TaxID=2628951 RepID=UPI00045F3FF8|nr:hypothetical protein [Geomicrobium sp. JCM 19037]GAK04080.1 hypothetical protein JCM19037_2453 [Geomicrobium sp. JCM 19037]